MFGRKKENIQDVHMINQEEKTVEDTKKEEPSREVVETPTWTDEDFESAVKKLLERPGNTLTEQQAHEKVLELRNKIAGVRKTLDELKPALASDSENIFGTNPISHITLRNVKDGLNPAVVRFEVEDQTLVVVIAKATYEQETGLYQEELVGRVPVDLYSAKDAIEKLDLGATIAQFRFQGSDAYHGIIDGRPVNPAVRRIAVGGMRLD